MPRRRPFALVYVPQLDDHVQAIEAKYRSLIRAVIEDRGHASNFRQFGVTSDDFG
jgi:hypothetical protein